MLAAAVAHANTVDSNPFAAKYPTYSSTFGCSACHTTTPALNSYGSDYKLSVEARGGRVTANVSPALSDIEPLDSDGDGYSNIAEISSNTSAGDAAQHPTLGVALSSSVNAISGEPNETVMYAVVVSNTGTFADSYTLGASITSGQAWTTSVIGTASALSPGASVNVQVRVQVPNSAVGGQSSVATLTATSQANPSVSATPLALTTSVYVRGPRFVDASTGANTSDCRNPGSPCRTITYAMAQAAPKTSGSFSGDTITVAPGTYNLALAEVFPIQYKAGITLVSRDGAARTFIDASGANQRIMNANPAPSCCSGRIEGFTFMGGLATAAPGSAALGGALLLGPDITVTRNMFLDNEARGHAGVSGFEVGGEAQGGAIFIPTAGTASVVNNLFVGNVAIGGKGRDRIGSGTPGRGGSAHGGAIALLGGSITVAFNTLRENLAQGGAGGSSDVGVGENGGSAEGGGLRTAQALSSGISLNANLFSANVAAGGAGGAGAPGFQGGAPGSAFGGGVRERFVDETSGNFYHANSPPGGAPNLDPLLHAPPERLRIRRTSPARAFQSNSVDHGEFDGRGRPNPASAGAYEPSEFPGDRTDLNRDRKSDILWRNSTTGDVFRFTMNGATINSAALAYQEPNTAWKIVGDADFNGDGFADLLWRNATTGSVFVMLSGAGGFPANGAVVYNEANPAWKIVATPDLDGDGRADILWWNASTGQVWALLMNGLSVAAQGLVYTEPNTAWRIEAVGELTFTGKTNHLVWRNITTGVVWLMTVTWTGNGFSRFGWQIYHEPDTAWRIVGSADFDGDGRGDLIWRNDLTGAVFGVPMNANGFITPGTTRLIHSEPNLAWKIVALGDYNGDGKADLLWRNESTGQVYMMLMNGFAKAAEALVYVEPNTAWKVMGPAEYAQ